MIAQRRALGRRLRVPAADAEDLIQDALTLLVENDHEVAPPARWSWFTRTLHNQRMHVQRDRALATEREPVLKAHFRALAPPLESPDAPILDEQRRSAARWLVAQVHESRRVVAELHLWEDRTLEEIAADMKLSLGTVRSRWDRAKEDMRAAIEREQKKQGGFAWLVTIVALLSAAWFWLFGRESHGEAGSPASDGARASRRRHARRLLAVAALPLLLSMEELPQETLSAADEPIDVRVALSYTCVPYLSTNAERETDAAQPPHKERAEAPDHLSNAAPDTRMDRAMLAQAAAATAAGKSELASRILRDHDLMFPHSPYVALRAKLSMARQEGKAPPVQTHGVEYPEARLRASARSYADQALRQ
ncbi:MAG: sigma-70 family RNA polymerase sigma factor [Polyangiaceae bacterium]